MTARNLVDTNSAVKTRLFHYLYVEDESEWVRVAGGELDNARAVGYIHLRCEEWFGDEMQVTVKGFVEALVQLYGCEKVGGDGPAYVVEIDEARDSVLSRPLSGGEDSQLDRPGLRELMKRHVHIGSFEQKS